MSDSSKKTEHNPGHDLIENYRFESIDLELVTLITEGNEDEADDLRVSLLSRFPTLSGCEWRLAILSSGDTVDGLVDYLKSDPPTLVVVPPRLSPIVENSPGGCGEHLDAILRSTPFPILLRETLASPLDSVADGRCDRVLVRLNGVENPGAVLNWGARMTPNRGHLLMTEDHPVIRTELQQGRPDLTVEVTEQPPDSDAVCLTIVGECDSGWDCVNDGPVLFVPFVTKLSKDRTP